MQQRSFSSCQCIYVSLLIPINSYVWQFWLFVLKRPYFLLIIARPSRVCCYILTVTAYIAFRVSNCVVLVNPHFNCVHIVTIFTILNTHFVTCLTSLVLLQAAQQYYYIFRSILYNVLDPVFQETLKLYVFCTLYLNIPANVGGI